MISKVRKKWLIDFSKHSKRLQFLEGSLKTFIVVIWTPPQWISVTKMFREISGEILYR